MSTPRLQYRPAQHTVTARATVVRQMQLSKRGKDDKSASWSHWLRFCSANGIHEPGLEHPLDPSFAPVFLDFAIYLASLPATLAPTTVQQYVHQVRSRISVRHSSILPPDPALKLFASRLTVWRPPARKYKQPAPVALVNNIISDTALDLGLRTAVALAFNALLRSSEYTSPSASTFTSFTLLREHISFDEHAAYMRVFLPTSKTDYKNIGQAVYLANNPSPLSAYSVVSAYLRETPHFPPDQPLLRLQDGRFITRPMVSATIKHYAAALGLDPDEYGTHSLRSGAARLLSEAGLPDSLIQLAGRWRSDAFRSYQRHGLQRLNAISAFLYGNAQPDSTTAATVEPPPPPYPGPHGLHHRERRRTPSPITPSRQSPSRPPHARRN
jgi:hypothetical protein